MRPRLGVSALVGIKPDEKAKTKPWRCGEHVGVLGLSNGAPGRWGGGFWCRRRREGVVAVSVFVSPPTNSSPHVDPLGQSMPVTNAGRLIPARPCA